MEEQLGASDTAAVLPHAPHRLGGVGKSHLAVEHLYRHQHSYRVTWWIPAERESLIPAVLAELLKLAQCSGEIDAQSDVREAAAPVLPDRDVRRRSRAGRRGDVCAACPPEHPRPAPAARVRGRGRGPSLTSRPEPELSADASRRT
ncbi:hypothetical protein ACIGPN_28235 [Streptomyces afghaniensis]|uniref:hypothetical protein n=1 Tax=Streptomyces afghaniensis TaxID=66865 RepID=UPI0037CF9C42